MGRRRGGNAMAISINPPLAVLKVLNFACGRVAEWFKAAVLKTAKLREGLREFESLPFRQVTRMVNQLDVAQGRTAKPLPVAKICRQCLVSKDGCRAQRACLYVPASGKKLALNSGR